MEKTSEIAEKENLHLPERIEPSDRDEWMKFFERLVLAHRHEDTLLHARVQSFIVATALLMAAVSQFKDGLYFSVALIFMVFGVLLSLAAHHVLSRTSKSISWHLNALISLEVLLFPNHRLRVYQSRRRMFQELYTGANANAKPPVSQVLGNWLPTSIVILWAALIVAISVVHWNRIPTHLCLTH